MEVVESTFFQNLFTLPTPTSSELGRPVGKPAEHCDGHGGVKVTAGIQGWKSDQDVVKVGQCRVLMNFQSDNYRLGVKVFQFEFKECFRKWKYRPNEYLYYDYSDSPVSLKLSKNQINFWQ